MIAFVDTSAFFAILDEDDQNQARAQETWVRLLREGHVPLTTNYVLIETCALRQRRLGIPALNTFHETLFPRSRWIGLVETGTSPAW